MDDRRVGRQPGLSRRCGFSLVELAIAIAVIGVLLAILVPSLSAARRASYRERCSANQALLGKAWIGYLADHEQRFPLVLAQPAWQWGGVRFSAVNDNAHLDFQRPITPYVAAPGDGQTVMSVFECPADDGIVTGLRESATGGRSVYRSFGTSFRANSFVLSGRRNDGGVRPIVRGELLASPAQLVLVGDAGWYEIREQTGRTAHWHGDDGACNLCFLDGSVRFRDVQPAGAASPLMFEAEFFELAGRPGVETPTEP